MELHLKNKTALVTAASSGLGFAAAQSLLNEGCRVYITSRTHLKVEQALSRLSSIGDASGCAGDLTRISDIDKIIDGASAFLGNIDVLVVSTGHPPTHPLREANSERWQLGFDLLLQPVIHLTKTLVPMMASNGYGRLIYVGSIFGLQPEPSSIIQSTFRTGLNAFAKCVATEYAPAGVTANVICPGYFDTPLVRDLAQQYATRDGTSLEDVLNEWKNFAPSKQFGRAEDFGDFVAYLASPKADFISGTAITIDGGAILQY